jgi:transcriptional regulator with XRE-family HTH domain
MKQSKKYTDPLQLKIYKMRAKLSLARGIQSFLVLSPDYKGVFAKKINKCPSEISKYFSGNHNFTIEILCEIAFALKVSLLDLFCYCSLNPTRIDSYGRVAPLANKNDLPKVPQVNR